MQNQALGVACMHLLGEFLDQKKTHLPEIKTQRCVKNATRFELNGTPYPKYNRKQIGCNSYRNVQSEPAPATDAKLKQIANRDSAAAL